MTAPVKRSGKLGTYIPCRIRCRVSELAAWKRAAKADDRKLGAWIRWALNRALESQP